MGTIGDHRLLHSRLKAGAGLGDFVPVHVGHGVPDVFLESILGVVELAVHLHHQDTPHTKQSREMQSVDERGHKSGDRWYGVQVTPLEDIRFIIPP